MTNETHAPVNQLPKGVRYDPERNRYRVRLYVGNRVAYLNYAGTYDEAMQMYEEACDRKKWMQANQHATFSTFDDLLIGVVDERI